MLARFVFPNLMAVYDKTLELVIAEMHELGAKLGDGCKEQLLAPLLITNRKPLFFLYSGFIVHVAQHIDFIVFTDTNLTFWDV